MARPLGENGKECRTEREAKVVTWKSSILMTHENCEGSISLKTTRNQRNHQECSQEIGNTSGSRYALQNFFQKTIRIVGVVHLTKSKPNLRVLWKLVNPQDCVWKNHCRPWRPTMLRSGTAQTEEKNKDKPSRRIRRAREESFLVPLKYIDVTRTTDTFWDVMLEKHFADFWNVDGDRMVRCMDRFYKVHFIEWKTTGWIFMVREEFDKKTNNHKTPQCMAGYVEVYVWCSEKHKWTIKKPKLHNARKLRGIYMRNSKTSWIMREESWMFRCQPQRIANNVRSTGKLVALKRGLQDKNTFALLRPMNLRGNAWKDLFTRMMNIILQEKGCVHWESLRFGVQIDS